MAIWTTIFLKSDLCLGAKWRGPWLIKYLQGSGFGVWLHHQSTSLDRAGENDKAREMNRMSKASLTAIGKLLNFSCLNCNRGLCFCCWDGDCTPIYIKDIVE